MEYQYRLEACRGPCRCIDKLTLMANGQWAKEIQGLVLPAEALSAVHLKCLQLLFASSRGNGLPRWLPLYAKWQRLFQKCTMAFELHGNRKQKKAAWRETTMKGPWTLQRPHQQPTYLKTIPLSQKFLKCVSDLEFSLGMGKKYISL